MTRVQAPGSGDQQEKTAAVGFVAFMALALGPLGAVVAAFAVGVERAWSGGATERQRAGERGRGWLTEQRAWLDADHKARIAQQKARIGWLNSGADPQRRPNGPSLLRRIGNGLHRLAANVAVAASDFASGAKDGWQAAQQTRKNGGGFREIAGSRPVVCSNCQRARVPVVADGLCADCQTAAEQSWKRPDPIAGTAPQPTPSSPRTPHRLDGRPRTTRPEPATPQGAPTATPPATSPHPVPAAQPATPEPGRCGRCGGTTSKSRAAGATNGLVFCPACDATSTGTPVRGFCAGCGTPGYRMSVCPQTTPSRRAGELQTFIHELTGTNLCPRDEVAAAWTDHLESLRAEDAEKFANTPDPVIQAWLNPANRHPRPQTKPKENTVTEPTASPNQAAAPASESNATVLRQKLSTTKGTLNRIAELTDQLAAERATLGHQVRDASEFATSTGQSAQAQQALDESNALAVSMGEQLGNFSQGAVSAEESMQQASDGLRVAENAEDALRSAGADGRAVAPASGASA